MQEIINRYIKLLDGITTEEWEELRYQMNNQMQAHPIGGIKVDEAARIMGKSPQFIRVGIQQGVLPFGRAVKLGKSNYTYYISPKLFYEFVGR